MPSAESAIRAFQASSTIAATGFIALIVQLLLAKYWKRKSQAKLDSPVALSAVTSGDEPRKPTTADSASSGRGKTEPDQAWKKPLHDKIDALISQARSQGEDDAAPEITRTATTYLLAAEGLLRLRGGGGRAGMTRARLFAAAGMLVEDTTAATASIRDLNPREVPEPRATDVALLTGGVSLVAALVAFAAAGAAESMVFGGQFVDLTSFTLRGEPRAAGSPPYLLVLAVSAAAWALRLVVAGLCAAIDLLRPVVMYPVNAAFNFLVSGMLLAGLPLGLLAVGLLSFLAVAAMALWASEASSKADLLALLEGVNEQSKTSVENCID